MLNKVNPGSDMYQGWITHTWNTVKGACPHDCSYCYMKRWGKQRPVRFDKRELKTDLGEGNFIFVGSSCDMFAKDIPNQWITDTLDKCAAYDNRYLFQSKNPYDFRMISVRGHDGFKAMLCTTIETNRWYPAIMCNSPRPEDRAEAMGMFEVYPRYLTIEPILDFDLGPLVELVKRCEPIQVNIGADSGNNRLPEPTALQIGRLIEELEKFTKVKRKKNLGRLFA